MHKDNVMQNTTTDQDAVAVMLSGKSVEQKQSALNTLLKHSAVDHGLLCEECDCVQVENNGRGGPDLTYRCTECGHQWSPNI